MAAPFLSILNSQPSGNHRMERNTVLLRDASNASHAALALATRKQDGNENTNEVAFYHA
jgi:hypothetical protein